VQDVQQEMKGPFVGAAAWGRRNTNEVHPA